MTNTIIDADVAIEIACHEAVVRQTYKDSVNVLTWSVGITNATGHRVNRYIGKPASMEHCLRIFAWALERYADDVRDAFAGVNLTKEQFAAALSFHYNTGAIARASWVKAFKAGNIAKARKAFMSWSKPKEIIGRRTKERDLFFGGKWSNDGTITEYTRVTSSMSPDWGSAKRVNVRADMERALKGEQKPAVPTPAPRRPQVTQVAIDAAAIDRVSTTNIAAGVTTVSAVTAAGKQALDAAKDATGLAEQAMSLGPWVLLAVVATGGGFYIYRERSRKAREARKALS